MPVAKHLSYASSRSRTNRSSRIDGPSFIRLSIHHHEAPRARPRQVSLRWPAIAAVAIMSRFLFRTAAQFAEAAGEILSAIASWMVTEMLQGCAAHALAMYGIPIAVDDEEPDAKASLHAISVGHQSEDSAAKTRSPPDVAPPCAEHVSGPRSGRRTAIIVSAVALLSKIQERRARQRAIAELRNLDDRSLRDIGISRTDIDHIARHGVRLE
jgi:uncharacterized protein YjiS (DUF1127 family)